MAFLYALGLGLLPFATLLVLQFIWWRWQPPRRHTKSLVLLFVAIGLAFTPLAVSFCSDGKLAIGQVAQALFLYAALFAAYLITYSAIEVDSPSLLIVQRVAEAGPQGLATAALRSELDDNELLIPRVEDLIRDKMLETSGDTYQQTEKGKKFIRIFIFYRGLLRRELGG